MHTAVQAEQHENTPTPVLAARMAAATSQRRGPITSPEAQAEATLRRRFPQHPPRTVGWALRAANGHAGMAARTLRGIPPESAQQNSPGVTTSEAELAALTVLHNEVAALAESFGAELPDGLHQDLESVEDQLAHVLDLSDMHMSATSASHSPGSSAETPEPLHHSPAETTPVAAGLAAAAAAAAAAASPSSSLRGTKMAAAAESVSNSVMKKLLRTSTQLDAPVTVACVWTAGCVLKCPATNFGADGPLAIEGSVLVHCASPHAICH